MRAPLFRAISAQVAVVLLGAGSQAAPGLEWHPAIQAIDSPAAEASAQPQLSVSARGVLLSWIERAGARATLKFAERTPTGWSEPRTAASGDDWFVNWADVPSVVRLDNGTLAAHWLQKSGSEAYAYDVRLAYSKTTDARGQRHSHRITMEPSGSTASRRCFRRLAPDSASSGWTDGPWRPPRGTTRTGRLKGP